MKLGNSWGVLEDMIKILQNKILLYTAAKLQVYIVSSADLRNEWFHPIPPFGLFCVHQSNEARKFERILHALCLP